MATLVVPARGVGRLAVVPPPHPAKQQPRRPATIQRADRISLSFPGSLPLVSCLPLSLERAHDRAFSTVPRELVISRKSSLSERPAPASGPQNRLRPLPQLQSERTIRGVNFARLDGTVINKGTLGRIMLSGTNGGTKFSRTNERRGNRLGTCSIKAARRGSRRAAADAARHGPGPRRHPGEGHRSGRRPGRGPRSRMLSRSSVHLQHVVLLAGVRADHVAPLDVVLHALAQYPGLTPEDEPALVEIVEMARVEPAALHRHTDIPRLVPGTSPADRPPEAPA